jgi:LuxR family maltose regulon positive regulatory protein
MVVKQATDHILTNMKRHELLNTKLIPPRLPAALVMRESLLARLNAGLDRKLTLISAPAGFGKTTLACEWIAARQNMLPIAWVSLDAGDNDPIRFWRYFMTACRAFGAALGRSARGALRISSELSIESLLTAFINEFAEIQTPCVFVLEDYHFITTSEIHQALVFLIEHLPATLHLVLITRTEPPLPLARLRARNDLNEIDVSDLKFSQIETHSFLRQNLQVVLSSAALNRIEEKTEG